MPAAGSGDSLTRPLDAGTPLPVEDPGVPGVRLEPPESAPPVEEPPVPALGSVEAPEPLEAPPLPPEPAWAQATVEVPTNRAAAKARIGKRLEIMCSSRGAVRIVQTLLEGGPFQLGRSYRGTSQALWVTQG